MPRTAAEVMRALFMVRDHMVTGPRAGVHAGKPSAWYEAFPGQTDQGPPGKPTAMGSGSGGPERQLSASHCRPSWRAPAVLDLNVVRPSRSVLRSSPDSERRWVHRAYARSCCGVLARAHAPRNRASPHTSVPGLVFTKE